MRKLIERSEFYKKVNDFLNLLNVDYVKVLYYDKNNKYNTKYTYKTVHNSALLSIECNGVNIAFIKDVSILSFIEYLYVLYQNPDIENILIYDETENDLELYLDEAF